MQRTLLPTGVLVLGLCLTGCSALKVDTAEGDSQPVSVGIDDGSEAQTPQKSAAPAIPAGMTEVSVDLGPECPIEVQLAMSGGWNDDLGYDSYQLYSRDNGAIITVNCYEDDGTGREIVDAARERTFPESGSNLMDETTGTVRGGSYWTFHGLLDGQEMRAIDETESVIYGAVAGISDNGRVYKVSVEMVTVADDQATAGLYVQMLPTVSVDDQVLESPTLS